LERARVDRDDRCCATALLLGTATMAADSRGPCGNGDNRRAFLKSAAAAGGAAAVTSRTLAWSHQPEYKASGLPLVTMGKTGQKVPVLGMGTSWDVAPSFVQAALSAGVRYIDTSETYEGGNAERTLGAVLERTKMRKDVYLVTKNSRSKIGGP